MSVIKHEFGMGRRQTARRFTNLLGLDALHEANVQANPLPYLERASERIFQLKQALFDASQANSASKDDAAAGETIVVDKADYLRLLKCRMIVEASLAQFELTEEHD